MSIQYLVYDDAGHIDDTYTNKSAAMSNYYEAVEELIEEAYSSPNFSDYIFVSYGEKGTDTYGWDIIESETITHKQAVTILNKRIGKWIRDNLGYLKQYGMSSLISLANRELSEVETDVFYDMFTAAGINVSEYL